jgi:PAS domain S-box-containing protein
MSDKVHTGHDGLATSGGQLRRQLERFRALFELAPVAYLVTDQHGVVKDANRRAADLLGQPPGAVTGRPLAGFLAADDRVALLEHLRRLQGPGSHGWELRLHGPRASRPVTVTVEVAGGQRDGGTELRWLLRELPPDGEPGPPGPGPAEAATARPGRPPEPDWDSLAEALHEMIAAAIPLLRADGVGLMLADQRGALRWVTATNLAEQAFEQAERDLGEGPCIDAYTSREVVWTANLRNDPRWPRLGPAARTNQIRGVLSAPVLLGDRPIGTCNALTMTAREWTQADAGAVRAFAVMLGRLIGSITDARHKAELTAQLQFALNSRVLVEQAKGVLMEREGVDARRAFEQLRRQARSSERKLAEVAREVIDRRA